MTAEERIAAVVEPLKKAQEQLAKHPLFRKDRKLQHAFSVLQSTAVVLVVDEIFLEDNRQNLEGLGFLIPCGMTSRQSELARHALGLDGRTKVSHRNRFFAGPGHNDYDQWTEMVRQGFAEMRSGANGSDLFWLTLRGAEQVLDAGESLSTEDFPGSPADTVTSDHEEPKSFTADEAEVLDQALSRRTLSGKTPG